jgi:hypothetical protein
MLAEENGFDKQQNTKVVTFCDCSLISFSIMFKCERFENEQWDREVAMQCFDKLVSSLSENSAESLGR